MKKRFLGIFMAVAMIVTSLPVMAFADVEEQVTEPSQEQVVAEQVEQAEVVQEEAVEEAPVLEKGEKTAPTGKTTLVYTGAAQTLLASKGDAKYFEVEGKDGYKGVHSRQVVGTDAKTYKIKYWWNEEGEHKDKDKAGVIEVTIAKADPTVVITKNANWDGKASKNLLESATITVPTEKGKDAKVEVTIKTNKEGKPVEFKANVKDKALEVTEAGTYTVYYRVKALGNANYNEGDANVWSQTVTVENAYAIAAEGLVYNGKAQQLLKDGKADYFWVKRHDWHRYTKAEDVVATEAGTYEVYYGKTFEKAKKVTVEIKKKVVTVTAQDAEKTFGYEDPEFKYVATGFVPDEDKEMQAYLEDVVRVERSRMITNEEAVGTYKNCIKLRWTEHEHYYAKQLAALNKNYEFEFERADFTINNVVIEAGAGQTYTQGTKGGATFKFDGIDTEAVEVYVDGNLVDAANYTVVKGSTILTLSEAYLKTLKVGKHTLKVVYDYKDDTTFVETEFTVAASPNTADANDMAPFAVLLMISIMGLAGVSLKRN